MSTALHEEVMAQNPIINAIARNEYEETIAELARVLDNKNLY